MERTKFYLWAVFIGLFVVTTYLLSVVNPTSAGLLNKFSISHFLKTILYGANSSGLIGNNSFISRFGHNYTSRPLPQSESNGNVTVRIGFLIMATGKYANYIGRLVEAGRTYMMLEHRKNNSRPIYDVHYFIFTDHLDRIAKGPDVTGIYQQKLGWPGDTLWRNQIYLNASSIIEKLRMDYLFSFDADLVFVADVGPEILGERVAANHPCFFNRPRKEFRYENRSESCAMIEADKGDYYFYGALFGGTSANFFDICRGTMACAMKDYARNRIIAIVEDESYLNRYFIDHPPTVILHPGYCTPEGWNLPFPRKIMALSKDHWTMRQPG